jgi:hypothetical protein
VPEQRIFEPFRDIGFRSILSIAFKTFPNKVKEILGKEGWDHFTDFMAAVERRGRVLFQFEGKPSAKTLEDHGMEGVISRMWSTANNNAMFDLLSAAFFGMPEGEADRSLSRKALFDMGITSWHTFSMAVLEFALLGFAEKYQGATPMDVAKPDTLLFYGLPQTQTPEAMTKVAKAFGLPTPQHLIALSSAFWSGDLTMEDLDRSVGRPEMLTELVNRAPSNPHKDIVFADVENAG